MTDRFSSTSKPKRRHGSRLVRLARSPALSRELGRTLVLAIPLMLGELSSILLRVADNIMIGRLGTAPLAAASIAGAAFVLIMLLVWGTIMVLPSPVAEAHERGEGRPVRTLLGAALVMSGLFSVICIALLAVLIANFHRLGQDPLVEALAVDYLLYTMVSMPVIILFSMLVQMIDAFSLVRSSMVVSILGLALGIFLNWVFIFGKLGCPALGMNGAALSNALTHLAMCAALIGVLWRAPVLAYMRRARTSWSAVITQTKAFLRLGLPSGVQTMVEFGAYALGTVLIGQMGATQQAAHQIALNLSTVSFVVVLGVSTSGAIRVGQGLAYDSPRRVRLAGLASMTLATLFMTIPMVFFLLLPGVLAGLYSADPAVLHTAVGLVVLAGLFQLADGLQSSSLALLRALGDVIRPSWISLGAYWLVGLPVGYFLAVKMGWQAHGIWVGYLIALVLQAVFFMRRFNKLVERRANR